jgi:tubulin--tyrosine ligase-like protein 12
VENCVNFNQIGEIMPKLEILNSRFTSKAGEWAMLFYARDQKACELNQIKKLNLSGKGVLHISDLSVFEQMSSLKTLDITDHPEFFMTPEEREEEEKKMKEGAANQEQIEFVQHNHTVEEFLKTLLHVEDLTCDEDLEEYILQVK